MVKGTVVTGHKNEAMAVAKIVATPYPMEPSPFAGLFTRLLLEPGHQLQGFARLQISLARGR